MTFIFYDTETTGTDVHFSQILQFAAILTDDDLNPLSRFEIRSRIQPHIVPSIGAMKATGVSAQQLVDPATPSHFEMVRNIHDVMSGWSPATVVGYNTIRFDEELLRQAFYQSLLPIYLTNTGGNSRLDIMKAAQSVYAFAPDTLVWPANEKGKPVFKLDQLAPANGFAHENAHDALADVEATIFIAKLIKQRAPDIWIALLRYRGKADASKHALTSTYLSVTRPGFGSTKSSLITALKTNPDNTGELIGFDLQFDPTGLEIKSEAEIAGLVTDKSSPIVSFRVNSCPVFLPVSISGPTCPGFELGEAELERRASLLKSNPVLTERLAAAFLGTKEPYPAGEHVEELIYGGFYSRDDQRLVDRFHAVDWDERFSIAVSFEDERLQELALRLIYNETPEVLSDEVRKAIEAEIADRLLTSAETKPKWTTFESALVEVDEILAFDPNNRLVLEHRDWLLTRQTEVQQWLSLTSDS